MMRAPPLAGCGLPRVKFAAPPSGVMLCLGYTLLLLHACLAVDTNIPDAVRIPAEFYVNEDTPVGSFVFSVPDSKTINWRGKNYDYSLSRPSAMFKIERNGDVLLKQRLDYELQPTHRLTVDVYNKDTSSIAYYVNVHVTVFDKNDFIPVFTSPDKFTVTSNRVTRGQLVGTLTALDKDATPENRKLEFGFSSERDSSLAPCYSIDAQTGEVTLRVIDPVHDCPSQRGHLRSFGVFVTDGLHRTNKTQVIEEVAAAAEPTPAPHVSAAEHAEPSDANASAIRENRVNHIVIPAYREQSWLSYVSSAAFLKLAIVVLFGVAIFLLGTIVGFCYLAHINRKRPSLMYNPGPPNPYCHQSAMSLNGTATRLNPGGYPGAFPQPYCTVGSLNSQHGLTGVCCDSPTYAKRMLNNESSYTINSSFNNSKC